MKNVLTILRFVIIFVLSFMALCIITAALSLIAALDPAFPHLSQAYNYGYDFTVLAYAAAALVILVFAAKRHGISGIFEKGFKRTLLTVIPLLVLYAIYYHGISSFLALTIAVSDGTHYEMWLPAHPQMIISGNTVGERFFISFMQYTIGQTFSAELFWKAAPVFSALMTAVISQRPSEKLKISKLAAA